MESVINWVISNIEIGRIPIQIRVSEPYASELVNQNIVTANIIFPSHEHQKHQIVLIDEQNYEWVATLCV